MSLPLRDTFYLLFRFYGWIWWKTLGKYQAFLKPIHLNKPPRQQCVVGLGQRDVFREWILSWQWDKGHEPSPCLAALGQNSDHALGTEHNQEPSPIWPVHVDVWQKPTQYCKAVILQIKLNTFLLKRGKEGTKRDKVFQDENLCPGEGVVKKEEKFPYTGKAPHRWGQEGALEPQRGAQQWLPPRQNGENSSQTSLLNSIS